MSQLGVEGTMRGHVAAGGVRLNRVHQRGRVCQAEDCGTVLSIYNATRWCWQHERPHPFILQAPRKRRRDARVA